MAGQHDVEVLTTCARDYITWANEYPGGHRAHQRRHGAALSRTRARATSRPSTDTPTGSSTTRTRATTRCRGSSSRARGARRCIDYLAQTLALRCGHILHLPLRADCARAADRSGASILTPTAHNEPAIHLGDLQGNLPAAKAIAYNTEVEKAFLKDVRPTRSRRGDRWLRRRNAAASRLSALVVSARIHGDQTQNPETSQPEDPAEAPEARLAGFRHTSTSRGARPSDAGTGFTGRSLYGGRIDPGKGCEELIEYFSTYVGDGGDASLVLMGLKLMPLPEEPFINFAGMLSEQERLQALEAATVSCAPPRTRAFR